MGEKKFLYLVTTRGFRCYVVAEDTEVAKAKFEEWLRMKDYGYYWNREFVSIEVIADVSTTPRSSSGCAYEDERHSDLLIV